MLKILVTNDDGVRSPGIHALAAALGRLGDVTVVAPHVEASAIGHALTLRRPLRMEVVGEQIYEVDGTPTDCVNVALVHIYGRPEGDTGSAQGTEAGRPDLIVSGINMGYNLGDDVTYSGTVAGAMEGALLGIPSIAVSLQRSAEVYDFGPAAAAAARMAEAVLERGLPPRVFLNLNIPAGEPRGFRVTVQAKRNHITVVTERTDPRGRPYYWIEEGQNDWEPHDRSDYQAVRDGYVSVTPLQPDLTAHEALAAVDELKEIGIRSRA
jgi:5'-nucleotidase